MASSIANAPSVSESETIPQHSDVEAPRNPNTATDIEHVPVHDDPRQWSNARKTITLCIVSLATVVSASTSTIQNPSNSLIQHDLRTTSRQISWTLAAFILIQGNFPFFWSAAGEIKGRKPLYLVAEALFMIGSAGVALSINIGEMIGMRVLQAAGSSAVLSISAATLADIYETHERGTKMGIFFAAPLLGPALGPIVGGLLSNTFNWRATFFFLVICGGVFFLSFLFLFKDTFRPERSLAHRAAVKRRLASQAQGVRCSSESTAVGNESTKEKGHDNDCVSQLQRCETLVPASTVGLDDVKLSIKDINPFPPYFRILSRKNNALILAVNGLIFGCNFCVSYTCERTLAKAYGYDALYVGLVLLCLGVGSIAGSVIGGRWSDRVLRKMKEANGDKWYAEMRLENTKPAMLWLPPSVVGFAWVCEKHVNSAAICVMLVLFGFSSMWINTSTLAYLVDANPGCSSTAIATNGSFRGTIAFISVMIAVPLQDALGDGGLYTAWAGILVIVELLILLVLHKGESWRKESEEKGSEEKGSESESESET